MTDSMATGTFSTRLLCKSECSSSSNSTRPSRPSGSNCYAVRFPFLASDPTVSTVLRMHHYHDVTSVRRVANTNEQSDDFIALQKCRRWRGGNAHGFAKGGRRAVPMAMVSWSPEPSLLNEMQCVDVFERVGEAEAEFHTVFGTLKTRSPWSLFQPQKVRFGFPN